MKYRVFDRNTKEYIDYILVLPNGSMAIYNKDSGKIVELKEKCDRYRVDVCTLEKDVNGKEIYENDLIQIYSLDISTQRIDNEQGFIKYRENSFVVDVGYDLIPINICNDLIDIEIIDSLGE